MTTSHEPEMQPGEPTAIQNAIQLLRNDVHLLARVIGREEQPRGWSAFRITNEEALAQTEGAAWRDDPYPGYGPAKLATFSRGYLYGKDVSAMNVNEFVYFLTKHLDELESTLEAAATRTASAESEAGDGR